eukprot:1156476-Pelagomonas_calceolata.AAC.11
MGRVMLVGVWGVQYMSKHACKIMLGRSMVNTRSAACPNGQAQTGGCPRSMVPLQAYMQKHASNRHNIMTCPHLGCIYV